MTKKAMNEALRRVKRGEIATETPTSVILLTPGTMKGLEALKVPQLQKLVNRHGLPYAKIKPLKKDDLIKYLITETRVKKTIIPESVDNFLANGGEIKTLNSRKLPKLKPEGLGSSVPHNQTGRIGDGVTIPKKSKKRKGINKTSTDEVHLQSILEEFGVKGTAARKALRSSDIKKPGKQWVWQASDKKAINQVRKFIKSLK